MRSKRATTAAGLAVCLAAVGCHLAPTRPTYQLVRPDSAPPQPGAEAAPAEPVADDREQEVDLVGPAVQGYIAQIDTIEQRSRRSLESDPPLPLLVPPPERQLQRPVREGALRIEVVEEPARRQEQADGAGLASRDSADSRGSQPTTTGNDEPPALASVTVQALAQPAASVDELPPGQTASVNRPVAAQGPPISLSELLRRWPENGQDAGFREQFDLRVLRVIAGDLEGARQPLALVSSQHAELARYFIESLIAIRQAHDGDATAAATRVLEELETLDHSLRRVSVLQIPTVALCHEVTGFGQYRLVDPPRFPSGLASEFVVYCELRNFVSERREDGLYHASFEMRTAILDSAGQTVLELRDTDIEDRCRQPRRDCFLPRLVRLPPTLPPGEYVAKITVIDKLGGKVAENLATFRVIAGL